jgi:hypothetical protein
MKNRRGSNYRQRLNSPPPELKNKMKTENQSEDEEEIECPDCGSTNCNCPEGIEARKQHE